MCTKASCSLSYNSLKVKTLSSEVYLSLRPAGRHEVTPTETWDNPAVGVMRPQGYPNGYLHGVWQPTQSRMGIVHMLLWVRGLCYQTENRVHHAPGGLTSISTCFGCFCGYQTGRHFLRCPSRLSDSWDPRPSPAHAAHLLTTGCRMVLLVATSTTVHGASSSESPNSVSLQGRVPGGVGRRMCPKQGTFILQAGTLLSIHTPSDLV